MSPLLDAVLRIIVPIAAFVAVVFLQFWARSKKPGCACCHTEEKPPC